MKKKTIEEFKQEVYNQVGNEYTVLGTEYINNKTPILMRHNCDKCNNYEWKIAPVKFLSSKNRCKKCAGQHRKTDEEFKQEVYNQVGNEYTVLGTFIDSSTPILIRHNCDKCNNHEWNVIPNNFIGVHKNRCPECYGNKRKTTKQFKDEINKKYNGKYTVLGEYKNSKTPILIRHNCDKCNNYEWKIAPINIRHLKECPVCSAINNESKSVSIIKEFLTKNNINFKNEIIIPELGTKRYDFYLPDEKILLEYDGGFHFSNGFSLEALSTQKNNDLLKNNYILNNKKITLKYKNGIYKDIENIHLIRLSLKHDSLLDSILEKLLIEKSSTTIDDYNILDISYNYSKNVKEYYLYNDPNYYD